MLIKILKMWDMSEKKRVPLFDSLGNHVIFTDPITHEVKPQFIEVPYQAGDILDMSDPSQQIKNGLAMECTPEGNPLHPLPVMTVDTMETISGRRYFRRLKEKYPSSEEWHSYLKEREGYLFNEFGNLMLLQIATRYGKAQLETNIFLDKNTEGIRTAATNALRSSMFTFVDDFLQQVKK